MTVNALNLVYINWVNKIVFYPARLMEVINHW